MVLNLKFQCLLKRLEAFLEHLLVPYDHGPSQNREQLRVFIYVIVSFDLRINPIDIIVHLGKVLVNLHDGCRVLPPEMSVNREDAVILFTAYLFIVHGLDVFLLGDDLCHNFAMLRQHSAQASQNVNE